MRLEDLANNEQYKAAEKAIEDAFQDTDTIDGTNLTENQEIKFRRTRLVSEVRPHKKTIHGKDFINYCEFLTGKRESCPKPKGIFNQILSLIRNNKPEFIIPSYKGLINGYFDLVTQAAEIKPRIAKQMIEQNTNKIERTEIKETNMQKKLERPKRKENPENTKRSQKAARQFENWLKGNMSNVPDEQKPKNTKYCGWVSYYVNHNGTVPTYYPKTVKSVLDKYSELLKIFKCKKGILILVSTESEIPESSKEQMELNKKKINKNTQKTAERFENWLVQNLDFSNPEKPANKQYSDYVLYFLRHNGEDWPSYWPEIVESILHRYSSKLTNVGISKNTLVLKDMINNTEDKENDNNSLNLIKEHIDYAIQDVKSTEKVVNTIITPDKLDNLDTLSKLIVTAKNAGASEITIKL